MMVRTATTTRGLGLLLMMALVGLVLAISAEGQTIGMIVDNGTSRVFVFDGETDTVLGSINIGVGDDGDCSITADQTLGFVTDFRGRVWVIDLTTTPPSLAPGTNPIPISNQGEDTSISPDEKFLLVCDGKRIEPVSVIDIANRTESSTFFLGDDCNSVDICSDGSVLVTSATTNVVRRLTIDNTGTLTDTSESLGLGGEPNNVFCAPGGASGLAITRSSSVLRSFTIPGLSPIDTRTPSGSFGISGLVNPAGTHVFARTNTPASVASVDVFAYDSTTGALGLPPLFTIAISNAQTYYGMDQIALHPNGSKLYVSQVAAVKVFDANTGEFLGSIFGPVRPTGVCFPTVRKVEIEIDVKPSSDVNAINPSNKGVIAVAVLSTAAFDALTVSPPTVQFGPSGASLAHRSGHLEDVDSDGDLDLVLHFRTQETGIQCGDAEASLTGETFDGQGIQGSDSILTVGCR